MYSEENLKSAFRFMLERTDDKGLAQHSKLDKLDLFHGYSMDDHARGLIVIARLLPDIGKEGERVRKLFLRTLNAAYRSDGWFRNFMLEDGPWKEDEEISYDCYSRCLWALGEYLLSCSNQDERKQISDFFLRAAKNVYLLRFPRSQAYALLGLFSYSKCGENTEFVREAVRFLGDKLLDFYRENASPGWGWFESCLTYANGRLPQALYLAYLILKEERYRSVAEDSLRFLTEHTIQNGFFHAIGNEHWFERGGERSRFDEQPIEAGVMTECFVTAFETTFQDEYRHLAGITFDWYYGKNVHNASVFDEKSGGVYDGLTPSGLNLNQGAESVLSYLLAATAIRKLPKPNMRH